jgi:mannan endo-1,4-beta-mannosidase
MKKSSFLQAAITILALTMLSSDSFAENKGFYIKGKKVFDANDKEFLIRGVSHAHTWYTDKINTAIPAIAKQKFNSVRVVLSNGRHAEGWGKNSKSDVKNVIDLCIKNRLIPILEVHDCTGYPEKSGSAPISTAVDYWIELKDILIGMEKYVIINIANEPYGNNIPGDNWVNGHKTSIKSLRNAGFTHLLMVDGANWGQDWQKIMLTRAQEVFDADSKKNTIFAIHMYEVYPDDNAVNTYLKTFTSKGLPILVGEFAANHGHGKPVAAEAILKRCKEYGLGYIGWSWKGNSSPLEGLDIALQWDGSSLTPWGKLLINSQNGIKSTSKTATVFLKTGSNNKSIQKNKKVQFFTRSGISEYQFTISQDLLNNRDIVLKIYNTKGAIVNQRIFRSLHPGKHILDYDRLNVSKGNYIVRLVTNEHKSKVKSVVAE